MDSWTLWRKLKIIWTFTHEWIKHVLPFVFAAALDAAESQDAWGQEAECSDEGDVDPPAFPVTSAEGEVARDEGQLAVGQKRHLGGHHTELGNRDTPVFFAIWRHPSVTPARGVVVVVPPSPPPPLPPPASQPSLLGRLDAANVTTPVARRRQRRRWSAEGVVRLDHSAVILVSLQLPRLEEGFVE